MAAGFIPRSAEICEFPAAPRRRRFTQRAENMQATVINLPEKVTYAVVDTCWYHAAAMAEEEKTPN